MSWDHELYFPTNTHYFYFQEAEVTLQLEQLVLLSHS